MRKLISIIAAIVAAAFLFSACTTTSDSSGQQTEDKSRQSNYDRLVQSQPAHTMTYSPTRATKNFWVDTWNKPGKLSYVYLRSGDGKVFGYYILVGLPVNYCTSLVVPYQKTSLDTGQYGGQAIVPGPSIDGTYSSTSNCNDYYGKDAVSGAFVGYTTGMGINAQISDQPLPQYGDAEPLAVAKISQVKSQ